MEEIKQLYIKLDPVKDADIVAFLQGKPRTYVVKEALRAFMAQGSVHQVSEIQQIPEAPEQETKKGPDNPFGNFAPKN